jgi:ketosteroid isomerase-like protein
MMSGADSTDLDALTQLNLDYIRSVEEKDVAWFERHLAPDFMNSNPDGSLVDRSAFIAQIARGAGVSQLRAEDVRLRITGDLCIIHARTTYKSADGKPAQGRYTDIWACRGGRWTCIAAHVTRR